MQAVRSLLLVYGFNASAGSSRMVGPMSQYTANFKVVKLHRSLYAAGKLQPLSACANVAQSGAC